MFSCRNKVHNGSQLLTVMAVYDRYLRLRLLDVILKKDISSKVASTHIAMDKVQQSSTTILNTEDKTENIHTDPENTTQVQQHAIYCFSKIKFLIFSCQFNQAAPKDTCKCCISFNFFSRLILSCDFCVVLSKDSSCPMPKVRTSLSIYSFILC